MSELVLYDGDKEHNEVVATLSAGYDVLFDQLKENYNDDQQARADVTLMAQRIIFQEIQEQSQRPDLHPAFVELLNVLVEKEDIKVDNLAQNAIHEVMQMSE